MRNLFLPKSSKLLKTLHQIFCLFALTSLQYVYAEVKVVDVSFTEIAGRPGHEGLFPLNSSPIAGQRNVLLARVLGNPKDVQVRFVSTSGILLGSYSLNRPSSSQYSSLNFFGEVTVPAEPFKMFLSGVDSNGVTFSSEQTASVNIAPTTIKISGPSANYSFYRGTTAVMNAVVTNFGNSDTFAISVSDNIGNRTTPATNSVQLKNGETKLVTFNISIPTSGQILPAYVGKVNIIGQQTMAQNGVEITSLISLYNARQVLLDIIPGSCENPLAKSQTGLVPVTIAGSNDLDVKTIDTNTIRLGGVSPSKFQYEDVGSASNIDCQKPKKDGITDMTLFFDSSELNQALRDAAGKAADNRTEIGVSMNGNFIDGAPFVGSNRVTLIP
jgi:hypothetical protein